MIFVLPSIAGAARYSFEIELDASFFNLSFDWNERAGQWLMSIADANGVPLLSGRAVVVGVPLANRFRDPRLPLGMLEAIDTSDSDLDPGFADLGDRVKILYTEVADLPASLVTDVS